MNNDTKARRQEFEEWYAEYFHACCSGEGRQPHVEEYETALAAWQARAEQDRAALKEVREALVEVLAGELDLEFPDCAIVEIQYETIDKVNKALATLDKLIEEKP